MGVYSKIEWCDATLDIISGCRHGCPYCYAKALTRRFSGDTRWNLSQTEKYTVTEDGLYILKEPFFNEDGRQIIYPFGFEPTLHLYKMTDETTEKRIMRGRSKRVFVGAMSDTFGDWVPDDWIQKIFDLCGMFELNYYLFLTKNPSRYQKLIGKEMLPEKQNFWYGTSVTSEDDKKRIGFLPPEEQYHTFISYEPMLGPLDFTEMGDNQKRFDWMIMGAQTGQNCKKVYPEREWVKQAVAFARSKEIPVFMKDSLIPFIGEKNMLREYPPELLVRKRSIKTRKKLEASCMMCGKVTDKSSMVGISGRLSTRGNGTQSIGYMCWDCLEKFCGEHGLDYEHIKAGIRKELPVKKRKART